MQINHKKAWYNILGIILLYIFLYALYATVVMASPMFILRSGYVTIGIFYKYILIYVIFSLAISMLPKKYKTKVHISLLLAPIIFLTSLACFVNFQELYPLVFPVVTILFILPLVAFLVQPQKKTWVHITNLALITAYSFFVYPQAVVERNLQSFDIAKQNLPQMSFLTVDGKSITLPTETTGILDFMFINCRPCIAKLPALITLVQEKIAVYVIVNGNIDSFDYFVKFYNSVKDTSTGIQFLYDVDGKVSKSLAIKAYPTEFILQHGHIIYKDLGFADDAIPQYLQRRKEILVHKTR